MDFFGSIGGGNSICTIKNVEFDSIQIGVTARGTTGYNNTAKGYHIGIVTGTIYKNSAIVNNIVKNCTIDDTNTISIRNSSYQFAVGGIAGYVSNTSSSETDPGTGKRYSIENCFADVEIAIDATLRNNRLSNAGQYAIGGIVGIIRSQPVWPSNCLYVGSINGNGFIGPIFGYLINNTAYTSTNNFATLWNGNDAGNLTMDSYYNSYSAEGTYFTQSVTSGTSNQRISNSTNNIGYVQGVNKGIYQSDISTMLSMFNNYAGSEYLTWKYTNGTFSFIKRFSTSIDDSNAPTYRVVVENEYSTNLTYKWYINGTLDESVTGDSITKEPSWESEYDIEVLVYDGKYYSNAGVLIPKLTIEIEFDIDNNNDKVTARLTGTALQYINLEDYTYQWYTQDLAGGSLEKIEGQTSLTLNNLEKGMDYRLIATNNVNNLLSAENSFTYGDRIVVYVDYQNGSNNNDGYTPQTPVQNLQTAYSKLSSSGTRNENIIVMMGNYTDTYLSFYNSQTSTTYAKKVTITGKYAGVDYNAVWRFGSTFSGYYFRYLTEDTTFMYLTLNGGNGYMYLICQGHSFTIGEQVTMDNYTNASSNQGLLGSNAPGFHLFAGWYQYNRTRLPNNNSEIIIKSGSYGRIVLGGTPGTSSGQGQTTSHDFMGSSMEDSFKVSITVDIQNSTTASEYDYDVNLLVGGSACGNNYSVVTENIKSGSVGRLLGGSIGDSAERPSTGNWWEENTWDYPENTFLGTTTINITGGSVNEVYGGCLGRNMNVVGSPNATGNTCDSYFYGTATINVTGGTITNNIYGAGAGGVTGYSENSSDPYKSYGEDFETTVNINISGGTIGGNIYGGGYGYTEYLNANVTAFDGGALYGDSNIVINGSPTINGNIYAAGCGYDLSSKPNIAQMTGKSTITINGTPTINGYVFGAGAGITGYSEMAKLIGDAIININANLYTNTYGGRKYCKNRR